MADDAKSLVQQQFGAHAGGYVTSPTHAKGYSLQRLIDLLDPQPGWRALDLATGGGHTALALARREALTIAGDLTRPMLHAAREHITGQIGDRVRFTQLDAEALPFPTDAFDVVTCRIAPHHFPNVAQFVRESARVTRPGGIVAVIDQLSPDKPKVARYINAFERLRDPSHVWAYNEIEWKGFFTAAGLEMVHYETFEVQQDLTAWAETMGCDRATILRLRAMLQQAPDPAAAWMMPELPATTDARFSIHQFMLIGRK
jgi:ubiquinone/menaquinone biosynthesis C-methylase UbiE